MVVNLQFFFYRENNQNINFWSIPQKQKFFENPSPRQIANALKCIEGDTCFLYEEKKLLNFRNSLVYSSHPIGTERWPRLTRAASSSFALFENARFFFIIIFFSFSTWPGLPDQRPWSWVMALKVCLRGEYPPFSLCHSLGEDIARSRISRASCGNEESGHFDHSQSPSQSRRRAAFYFLSANRLTQYEKENAQRNKNICIFNKHSPLTNFIIVIESYLES